MREHTDLYTLVESASRAIATTHSQMAVFLETEQDLARQAEAPLDWRGEIAQARVILSQSPDLPTFLAQLHQVYAGRTTVAAPTPQPSDEMEETLGSPENLNNPKPGVRGTPSQTSSGGASRPRSEVRRRTPIG